MLGVAEQERNAEQTKARIGSDVEIGRDRIALDGAELDAFENGWRSAKLAARECLDLDPPVGRFLQNLIQLLAEFVLHVTARNQTPFNRVLGGAHGRT